MTLIESLTLSNIYKLSIIIIIAWIHHKLTYGFME